MVCGVLFGAVYCPSEKWFPVDTECLYFGPTATTWPLARSHCISIGSRLVQPQQQAYSASTFIAALRHFMIRIGNE